MRRHLDGDRDELDGGVAEHRGRIAVARARAKRSCRGIRIGLTRRRDGDELEPGERADGGHVRFLRPAALRARPDDADPDRLRRHATMLLRRCGAGPAPIGYGRRHRLHRGTTCASVSPKRRSSGSSLDLAFHTAPNASRTGLPSGPIATSDRTSARAHVSLVVRNSLLRHFGRCARFRSQLASVTAKIAFK